MDRDFTSRYEHTREVERVAKLVSVAVQCYFGRKLNIVPRDAHIVVISASAFVAWWRAGGGVGRLEQPLWALLELLVGIAGGGEHFSIVAFWGMLENDS